VAIFLAWIQPHSSSNHLNQQIPRLCRPSEQHAIDIGNISPFCKDSTVDKYGEFPLLERIEARTSLNLGRISSDKASIYAMLSECVGQSRYMSKVNTEYQSRLPSLGFGKPATNGDIVDLLSIDYFGQLARLEVAICSPFDLRDVCLRLYRRENHPRKPFLSYHIDVILVIYNLVDSSP
jgi:hypothetical protein